MKGRTIQQILCEFAPDFEWTKERFCALQCADPPEVNCNCSFIEFFIKQKFIKVEE